ncbi:hypothetical protein [Sporosarcina luteola]|uniref:hypothetical protein n=1 Tax=Sporosarcina luteola TaxID=582850 RepID=UPI00203C78F2|nr:hypothetical protein [Sporosarcina luteola]MCM3709181.1 hypothetical protein [Sporosarcina luteola]
MSIKHRKLKSITLITLLAVTSLISACGVEKTNAESKDISNYPEGVQNGTVSIEYYDELISFLELEAQHQLMLEGMMDILDENPKLIYSTEKVDEIRKSISSYNDFLINFNPVGTTEAEKEFSALIMDITERQLALNSSLDKYIESRNVFHLLPAVFRSDSDVAKRKELQELAKKHKILGEKTE